MTAQDGSLKAEETNVDTLLVVGVRFNEAGERPGTTHSYEKISTYFKEHGYKVQLRAK